MVRTRRLLTINANDPRGGNSGGSFDFVSKFQGNQDPGITRKSSNESYANELDLARY